MPPPEERVCTQPAPVPTLDLAAERAAIGEDLRAALLAVLDSGAYVLGPTVEAFEGEIADWLGVRHAVSVNSGTDALVIGLRALGIGAGDEVVTTSYSFLATAEAVCLAGATPVFVDVDPRSFNLDPARVAEALSPRTRAIMPVHLYGQSADMDAILSLARERGLVVLEDAAQAIGATWRGRKLGTLGDLGAFSFYPTKNLGCYGDGGLIVTDDEKLAAAARSLRNHGQEGYLQGERIGYNSRLDAFQAAVLRTKLPHLAAWNEARRRVADAYDARLAGDERFELPPRIAQGEHVFHQYTVRVRGGRGEDCQRRLNEQGIQARVFYDRALPDVPAFEEFAAAGPFDEARRASAEVLSLPIGPWITAEQQQRVADALLAMS